MYAVVSSGGKQYRVEPGTTLTMERIGSGPGEAVTFDRVLLVGDGDEVTVGTPVVSGASVSATLLGEELGPKLVIFKFKQKVKYRRRTGHRQHLVRVRIDAINVDGKSTRAERQTDVVQKKSAGSGKAAAKPRTRRAAVTKAKAQTKAEAKAEKSETAETAETAEKVEKPKTRRTAKPKASAGKADSSAEKPARSRARKAKEQ